MPLRAAQAALAVIDEYAIRDRLGAAVIEASAGFNDERLALLQAGEALETELSGIEDPVRRSAERKQIDLHRLAGVLEEASVAIDAAYGDLRRRWLDVILGEERENEPASAHVAYVRRLSPLAGTYTKERSVPVCLATLTRARLRPRRRRADPARPRRSPAEEPEGVRHRLRPPQRRPPDHSRPGRPRRLPGVPARGRARAALRRVRPGASVHVPAALARPRPDRDLLVPRRVAHA